MRKAHINIDKKNQNGGLKFIYELFKSYDALKL